MTIDTLVSNVESVALTSKQIPKLLWRKVRQRISVTRVRGEQSHSLVSYPFNVSGTFSVVK